MMYRSKPCLPFFSSIVKNIASPNIEIKKLVYIYLLHHAELEPDLALLSINTIQKSLTDQNPQVRAMALRVMSGIRVPVISQIVSLAIKRGCGDMSPYVRKAAALAIPKCYRLDPNTLPQLLGYLSTLIGDKQYYVVGSAVAAFLEVCPDRIDLIHKHYRTLVKKLVDMDEWGQLATLKLLTIYSRKCFPRRTKKQKKNKGKGSYEDEEGNEKPESSSQEIQELDPDLELFLKACRNALHNRNSAVIVSVARCFLYLGTSEYINYAIGPLVALLRSPQDVQQIAMYNIVAICLVRPDSFVRYATHFLIRASDIIDISRLKFEVLTLIFPHCESHIKELILSELEHFTRDSNAKLVQEAVRAIGRCAQKDSKASAQCLGLLLQQISSQDGNLVAESLTVIRHLIQQHPEGHIRTVIRLAKNLDTTSNPEARATIIWLVGEFSGVADEDNIAPDVLRILAKGFADESEPAKLQIVLLAAKVYLHYLNRTQSTPSLSQPEARPLQIPSITFTLPVEEGGFQDSTNTPSTNSVLLLDSTSSTDPNPPADRIIPTDTSFNPEHPIPILWRYILLLVRYDTSYDLRDRTRTYRGLLANPSSTELASLLLLAPKPVPHAPSPSESRKGLLLGSSSLVVGSTTMGLSGVQGYEALPEWVEEGKEPDAWLRDGEGSEVEWMERAKEPALKRLEVGNMEGKGKGKEKSLDDWLAEEESGESESEESDEEEEEEEGSEEEESEEESGEEGERVQLVKPSKS